MSRAGRQQRRARWMARLSAVLDGTHPLLLAGGATVLHATIYGLANRFPLRPPVLLPLSMADRAVPLLPWTTVIYLSSHLLVFWAFVSCRTPGSRGRFALSFFTVVLLAALIHWALPVQFPRHLFPDPGEAVGGRLLRALRWIDRPSSCVPSLHVAAAVVAAVAARQEMRKRSARLLWAWVAGVCLSTLTTKQHYAVDVITGAALAVAVHLTYAQARSGSISPPDGGRRGRGARKAQVVARTFEGGARP